MQRKDIRVGGEYAWKYTKYGDAGKVKVTGLDVTKVQGQFRTREVPAVEIEILSENFYNLTGKSRVVFARDILAPWAEYEAERAEKARVDAEKEAAEAAAERQREENLASVQKVLADHGLELHLEDWSWGRFLVNIDELAEVLGDLVRAAYARGVADTTG